MKTRRGLVSVCVHGAAFWLVSMWCFMPLVGVAAEIAGLRLTGLNAFLESRNRYSETRIKSVSGETLEREPRLQKELGLVTHSYVYHPNLLQMDISGSVFLDQRSFTRAQTTVSIQEEDTNKDTAITWNLAAHFRFLREKPYPVTLYYQRQNPLVSTGLAGSFNQRNTEYGLKFALLGPFSPIDVQVGASRRTSLGEGPSQVVDETFDLVSVRASRTFLKDGRAELLYDLTRLNSSSGSPDLPILMNGYTEHRTNFNSRLRFGGDEQYELSETATYTWRSDPQRLDARFSPVFRWRHSSRLDTTYRYDFSMTNLPGNADSLRHAGSAAVRYVPNERWFGGVEVHAEKADEASAVKLTSFGLGSSGSYIQPVPFGRLTIGLGVNYDLEDQKGTLNLVSVRDESLTMTGVTTVTLARDFALASSVKVTNTARTQTFIEGLDYELIVIGSQTQLRRLIAGNILEGQTVLVDYSFESRGTFKYSVLGSRFTAELEVARFYRLYLRYQDNRQTVQSGDPGVPLNSVRTVEVGARANVPLRWRGITVGAEARYTRQEEDIAPFDSTKLDAFMQLPLPYRSMLRLSVRQSLTNNYNFPSDNKLTGFTATLRSRPMHRLSTTAMVNYEVDTGSLIKTRRSEARIGADWQVRRVKVNAFALYLQEKQGEFDRERLEAWVTVRRELW